MPEYRLSERAAEDLDEIADYGLENWGMEQTRIYRKAIIDCFGKLARTPQIGHGATQYSPLLKRFNFKAHSIFYEITVTGIFIVRILGKKQSLDLHL